MLKSRDFWPKWARILQRFSMQDLAVTLLEASGPLHLFLAQLIYAGQPLFDPRTRPDSISTLDAIAGLLEDRAESRAFCQFLREEKMH